MLATSQRPRSRATGRTRSSRVALLALLLSIAVLPACAVRTVRHSIEERNLMEIDLIRDVSWFTVEEKGYEHPTIISVPRLINILTALEVEMRDDDGGKIRQPAFHADIIEESAEGLAKGLAAASPNEEVAINAIRKEMRLGIFHKKFLTSFLAHVKEGHLYLSLRRIEWPIPRAREDGKLPDPMRARKAMNFRVVTADPIYFAGVQDLEIDWKSDLFRQAFRMPGSTDGERRRRDILDSIPVPKEEIAGDEPGALSIESLTPEQLRALADLEEDRRAGKITETDYQRARRQLLRRR